MNMHDFYFPLCCLSCCILLHQTHTALIGHVDHIRKKCKNKKREMQILHEIKVNHWKKSMFWNSLHTIKKRLGSTFNTLISAQIILISKYLIHAQKQLTAIIHQSIHNVFLSSNLSKINKNIYIALGFLQIYKGLFLCQEYLIFMLYIKQNQHNKYPKKPT